MATHTIRKASQEGIGYPKVIDHVVTSYATTRAFWVDCQVVKGSVEQDYPVFRVQVTNRNRIDVIANEGVRKMTFFFSDKLVDMTGQLHVTFQGKDVHKGRARPRLTVALREGEVAPPVEQTPLWEQLVAVRSKDSPTGAMDWLYVNVQTAFRDTRLNTTIPRRVSLDIGLRAADGPAIARIVPASKQFVDLDVTAPGAALKAEFSGMRSKLPVQATVAVHTFDLSGSVDRPQGDDPSKLTSAGRGKSGEVVLMELRLVNPGDKDLVGVIKLYRNPFLTYPIGVWPKDGSLADTFQGIYEVSGTKGVSWQYFNKHGNEAYQVLGLLMMSTPKLPKPAPLVLGKGNEFPSAGLSVLIVTPCSSQPLALMPRPCKTHGCGSVQGLGPASAAGAAAGAWAPAPWASCSVGGVAAGGWPAAVSLATVLAATTAETSSPAV